MSLGMTRAGAIDPPRMTIYRACLHRECAELIGTSLGLGVLASILEPIFHIGVVVLWHYLMRVIPIYGVSKVLFISSGLYPLFLFIHTSEQFNGLAQSHSGSHRYPVVSIFDVFLAKASIKLMIYGTVGIVLFSGIYFFITPQGFPFDPGKAVLGLGGLAVLGVGVGMANAAIIPYFPSWRIIYSVLARSMIIFGGILYVPDLLPVFLRRVLAWNPAMHGVELFRQGFYPNYPTVIFSGSYFGWWVLGSCFAGAVLLQNAIRKIDHG